MSSPLPSNACPSVGQRSSFRFGANRPSSPSSPPTGYVVLLTGAGSANGSLSLGSRDPFAGPTLLLLCCCCHCSFCCSRLVVVASLAPLQPPSLSISYGRVSALGSLSLALTPWLATDPCWSPTGTPPRHTTGYAFLELGSRIRVRKAFLPLRRLPRLRGRHTSFTPENHCAYALASLDQETSDLARV